MKYLKQFAILCACLFAGSLLKALIPLPIPETLYAMIILFVLFLTKKLSPDDQRETSAAIVDNMAILFLPAGVGIIDNFDMLVANLLPILVITIGTSFISMAITMAWFRFLNKGDNKNVR